MAKYCCLAIRSYEASDHFFIYPAFDLSFAKLCLNCIFVTINFSTLFTSNQLNYNQSFVIYFKPKDKSIVYNQ